MEPSKSDNNQSPVSPTIDSTIGCTSINNTNKSSEKQETKSEDSQKSPSNIVGLILIFLSLNFFERCQYLS